MLNKAKNLKIRRIKLSKLEKNKFYNKVWRLHRRKQQTSNTEKTLILLKIKQLTDKHRQTDMTLSYVLSGGSERATKWKLNSVRAPKNIKFDEFDTIKHVKNFLKYGVWYGRTYYVIFQKKYGTVLFGTVRYLWKLRTRESVYYKT